MRFLRFASLLLAALAWAADVSGTWQGKYTRPDGEEMETTITLKASGDALSGTMSNQFGEAPISEGKVKGDEVQFVVVRNWGGEDHRIRYRGRVEGDTLKLNVSVDGGQESPFTAKRK
jgi:hypothetical protein